MKIRELLSDETKWTKGGFAKTADGEDCMWTSPCATCWCLDGAIMLCYNTSILEQVAAFERFHQALPAVGDNRNQIVAWNDAPERTFAEVKALVESLDI